MWLDPALLHQGRGSPRPPHKVSSPLHTKPEGRRRFVSEPLRPQGFRHTLYNLIHSRITSQCRHILHSLNSKLSLALRTHKSMWSLWINNLEFGWLGYDLLSILHSSALPHNPANLNGEVEGVKIGQGIKLVVGPKLRKVVPSDDPMLCFFWTSVHLVLLAVVFHCSRPLTQLMWRFNRHTVSSSGAEDFAGKTLLLAFVSFLEAVGWTDAYTIGSSGAEDLRVKTLLLADILPSEEPMPTRRFISCYCSYLGVSLSCFKQVIE
jgi:hypothetical protein